MKLTRNLFIILFCACSFTSFAQDEKVKEVKKKIKVNPWVEGRPNIPGNFYLQLGVNSVSGMPDTLSLKTAKSRSVGLIYTRDIRIGKSKFSFHPGIGANFEKYSFDDSQTLVAGYSDLDESFSTSIRLTDLVGAAVVKKSVLAVNTIEAPFELRWHLNDNFEKGLNVGIGGQLGYVWNQHTKGKYVRDDKRMKYKNQDQYGISKFRYGGIFRLGVGSVSLLYKYDLNDLFYKDRGPAGTNGAQSQSFYLTIDLF